MQVRVRSTVALCIVLAACGASDREPVSVDDTSQAQRDRPAALEIAQTSIIVDTHIDVPYRLNEEWADVSQATTSGDFDYPRALEGRLNVAFMSIYTPAGLAAEGGSRRLADRLIDMVESIAADAPDKFAIAYSSSDVERQFAAGLLSLPLGMENGSPLEGDLDNVAYFHGRGIRYITLAHSKSNALSDSSYDDNEQWGGLSDFGFAVVGEMNRLGIMVDVSHLSDQAFEDVIAVSKAPVIASHSSARRFTPGWERNMSDDMILRLAGNGGVIMINFGSAFLTEEAWQYSEDRGDAYDAWIEKTGTPRNDGTQRHFADLYAAEHGPFPYATLDQALDHFDHVIGLAGVEHVGIGSDFDGVGDSLPVGLKDVSDYPNLIDGLLGRGYTPDAIRRILGENLVRVWRDVEAIAESLSRAPGVPAAVE